MVPSPRIGIGGVPAVAWSSLLGLLAVALLFALVIRHDRNALVAASEGRADEQALILADHATRLFEAAELALGAVIDDTQPLTWSTIQRSQPLWRRVRHLADRLPYIEAFWLYGSGGKMRLTSLAFPAPPLDVSARDFFVATSSGSETGVHVSDVVRTSDGRATFRLSRRLINGTGDFRGVASLTIDVDYFRSFYDSLNLPEPSSVSVLRAKDLAVLVGQPIDDPDQLREAIAGRAEAGRIRISSSKDGAQRVVAYRRVPGFPLYVTVDIPQAAIHHSWVASIAWRAPMAVGAAAALAALTWLGFRQARRQSEFQGLLELKVAERTGELARANAQLEALVHEVHHRVNNNLQVIVSLLALQTARVTDAGGRRALRQCSGRVHTLSLVHQTLYGTGAMTELAFRDYLERLSHDIGDIYDREDVTVTVDGANPVLPLDVVVPLALIVHEALCNALNHAFPGDHSGTVRITLGNDEQHHWLLSVIDDGVGMPAKDRPAKDRPEGLGLTLIRSLAAQVGATVSVETKAGTEVNLRVPL